MEELIGTHNEYYLRMWITRNKRDTYEEDSLILWIEDEKPNRIENSSYQYWFGVCGVDLKLYKNGLGLSSPFIFLFNLVVCQNIIQLICL